MKTTQHTIKATASRYANGWRATLEFPNGGRQVFSSLHGTMESAENEARGGLRCRLRYPGATVRDPNPNELQDFSLGRP